MTWNHLLRGLELALGLLIWLGSIWDGFATIVLPRTVAPMRRLSGRFYRLSWRIWSSLACRIQSTDIRIAVLAVYGPISVMLLMIIWAILMILGFALIFHALGPRFQESRGPAGFGTLLYMSASTFLTLGLGDVTSTDLIGRLFVILESGTGYLFLGLIITYMPVLEQAYSSREVGNQLIHSRAGTPPSAIRKLHRYANPDRRTILRDILRECERWMSEIVQTHLSHPVLSFYRAQHWGQSWLVSLTIILDSCSLLIVCIDGLAAEQARLTYRMGVHLLKDLAEALGLSIDPQSRGRLTEAELPALAAAIEASALGLTLNPHQTARLLRLTQRYDAFLVPLSEWLAIPLPGWIPPESSAEDAEDRDDAEAPPEWEPFRGAGAGR